MSFEVLTAVNISMFVLWILMLVGHALTTEDGDRTFLRNFVFLRTHMSLYPAANIDTEYQAQNLLGCAGGH
jgi:hypothetical protein